MSSRCRRGKPRGHQARQGGDGSEVDEVSSVLDSTEGGASISIDAIGSPSVMYKSVSVLRKRGRHVQIGLMEADEHDVKVPANLIIAKELEILGSHGMQAHRYSEMLGLIERGELRPDRLVGRKLSLEFPDEVPVFLQILIAYVVISQVRREGAAAAGG